MFHKRRAPRRKPPPAVVTSHIDAQRQQGVVDDHRDRVRDAAAKQWGHVGGWQLADWGIPTTTVQSWVRRKWLLPRHRGSYAVGHRQSSGPAEIMAAVLAMGRDAVASHLAAAVLWGMIKLQLVDVDVSTPRDLHDRKGIKHHRNSKLAKCRTSTSNIPVTTPEETIVGLAESLWSDRMLRRAINQALVDRLISVDSLAEHLTRSVGRAGIGRISKLLPRATPTRSFLEDDVFNALLDAGVPRPETNVEVEGEELDLYWRELNFGVDLDSAKYHDNPIAKIIDAEKTARLRARKVALGRQRF